MNPGQGSVCRGCLHFLADAWNEDHPNPCKLNAWHGEQHYSPTLAVDGRSCEDYHQQSKPVDNSSLEPRAEVPNRPKTCLKRTPHEGILT